jgi:hypothetical protein
MHGHHLPVSSLLYMLNDVTGVSREGCLVLNNVWLQASGRAENDYQSPSGGLGIQNVAAPQRAAISEEASLGIQNEGDPVRPSLVVFLVDRERRERAPLAGSAHRRVSS